MPRIIGVISGKGGVGKTTAVANIACALARLGKTVTVIDGNLSTSNLGLAYGLYDTKVTLNQVLRGEAYLPEAMYMHESGVWLVPASMDLNEFRGVDIKYLNRAVNQLFGFSDFVILDSAPGVGNEAIGAIAASREVIFVTTPHMPSIVNAVKSYQIAKEVGGKVLGIVMNRVKGKGYEYFRDDIEKMSKLKVLAEIPEDENVLKSANSTKPAIMSNPFSPASIAFTKLAAFLADEDYKEPTLTERFKFLITKEYHPKDVAERIEHYQKTAAGRLEALRRVRVRRKPKARKAKIKTGSNAEIPKAPKGKATHAKVPEKKGRAKPEPEKVIEKK